MTTTFLTSTYIFYSAWQHVQNQPHIEAFFSHSDKKLQSITVYYKKQVVLFMKNQT